MASGSPNSRSGAAARGGRQATISGAGLVDPVTIATAPAETRLSLLASSPAGLSETEAAARLRRFGPNQPLEPAASHQLRAFAAQFVHTLALLLWFAAGLAYAAGIPELGTAIVAIVLINGVFAFVQEYRAEQVIARLMRHVAVQARVMRDGVLRNVPALDLVPGDVIHLQSGDVVAADCVLLEAENLAVDLSMLTGETMPVERNASAPDSLRPEFHISDVVNMLPAGAGVVLGRATAAVWATGPESSIGAIAGLVQGEKQASLLERQVAQLSRLTATIAVLAGAATLSLAALITETDFLAALTFSTGIVVALVPEGLLPILSVALAIGAARMADRQIAVRRLSAVEVVGSVTVICTDKTGTLTENALAVEGCIAPDGSRAPTRELLLAAVLCNDASGADGSFAGDPIDVALLRWASTEGLDPANTRQLHP
ncbi:MAG TPA: HAD-IC family P-type ATPase, partial [Dehalococcoidia bacterium]|nr:HAD-IC family P-type ATPase [Dehalococcoidia bacterium]